MKTGSEMQQMESVLLIGSDSQSWQATWRDSYSLSGDLICHRRPPPELSLLVRKFAFSCGALGAEFASSASEVNPPDLLELDGKMKLRPWVTVIWFSALMLEQ